MSETITDAARREAERLYISPNRESTGLDAAAALARAIGFVEGAHFGAAWERDREPSEAEVEAVAIASCATGHYESIWAILSEDERDDFRDVARRILAAARAARKEAEG